MSNDRKGFVPTGFLPDNGQRLEYKENFRRIWEYITHTLEENIARHEHLEIEKLQLSDGDHQLQLDDLQRSMNLGREDIENLISRIEFLEGCRVSQDTEVNHLNTMGLGYHKRLLELENKGLSNQTVNWITQRLDNLRYDLNAAQANQQSNLVKLEQELNNLTKKMQREFNQKLFQQADGTPVVHIGNTPAQSADIKNVEKLLDQDMANLLGADALLAKDSFEVFVQGESYGVPEQVYIRFCFLETELKTSEGKLSAIKKVKDRQKEKIKILEDKLEDLKTFTEKHIGNDYYVIGDKRVHKQVFEEYMVILNRIAKFEKVPASKYWNLSVALESMTKANESLKSELALKLQQGDKALEQAIAEKRQLLEKNTELAKDKDTWKKNSDYWQVNAIKSADELNELKKHLGTLTDSFFKGM